ncbi:MAG TPA: class IV adenylate cyclase [Verrucomicrobiae bacterium]|nr:class IV adenylate cyclase [Verrucomicrobiae bacterium]
MREIEIKARVDNHTVLLENLVNAGVTLGQPLTQHDVVYLKPDAKSGSKDTIGLRIRTENDSVIRFTLKKIVSGGLDKIEHEIEVDNSEELAAMINLLGFELYSDLTKIRRKTKVGAIEICVDEVSGLGNFIEAEMLVGDDADHDTVVTELWKLFTRLGIKKVNEIHEGYDILDRRSRGLPL